jgi:hypothetical protein
MCPACFSNAALVVAGVASGGGLAGAVFRSRWRLGKKVKANINPEEDYMKKSKEQPRTTVASTAGDLPQVVSPNEWLSAREKEFNRQRDALSDVSCRW